MPRCWIGPVLIELLAAAALAGGESPLPCLRAASNGRSQVLFVSSPELRRRLNIYIMDPDGSHPRNLTETEAEESDPVWSPDGAWIAFAAMNDLLEVKSDLYLMRADGSRRRRLTNFPAGTLTGEPTWSPDGKQILFATATIAFGNRDHPVTPRLLRRIDRDGTNLKLLREGSHPSWSPDGKQILYTGVSRSGLAKRGQSCLYVMSPDGRNSHQLVDREASGGAWSPDGRLIAYSGIGGRHPNSQYSYSDLFVMNADGSHAQRLTNDDYSESAPQWSPTGQHILFSPLDSYSIPHGIISIDRDGRNRKELPHSDRYAWLGSDLFMLAYRAMRIEPIEKTSTVVRAVQPEFDHLVECTSCGDTARLRELLRRGADPNAHSGTGKTILMEAAQFGPAAAVRVLLDHGADPRARMKDGRSALWWAVNGHQLEHARLLIERGTPLEAIDGEGRTALMLACQLHVGDLVGLLMDRGAHPDAPNKFRATPLMWAARAGDLSMVQILLKGGADVNAHPSASRITPLMAAISAPTDSIAIMRVLVGRGADLAAKDSRGRTALDEAEENHLTEAAQLLRAAAARKSGGVSGLTGTAGRRKKIQGK